MTVLSHALSAALLHFIWQGTAVAFLLWVALLLLRNRTANSRYLAACMALALIAAAPVATTWVLMRTPVELFASGSVGAAIPHAVNAAAGTGRTWLVLIEDWALPVWAAGVALFAIRLALSYRHVAILRRTGIAVEGSHSATAAALAWRMRVTRPVRVLVSKLADSPSVVGWLRPVILLPAAALIGLDAEQLEAVLAHELAHIRRHDYLVNVLQAVIESLLFYHPAVWWVSARMRNERELCCDDLAVRHCGDAIGYARALTKLERMRTIPEPAVAANGGSLLYRIQRLTGVVRECAPSRVPAVLALVVAGVCVPLVMAPRAHGQPQETEAAAKKNITGTVLVEATLDGEGNVADARVLSGPAELRKTALRSVLEWRLALGPEGAVRQVTVEFTPEDLAAWRTRLAEPNGDAAEMARTRESLVSLQRKLETFQASTELTQLRELQQQLVRARQIYTDRHPAIRNLSAQIELLQKKMRVN